MTHFSILMSSTYFALQSGQYSNLDALEKDLLLMVNNAKAFNEPGSQVYRDSYTLRRVISGRKNELEKLLSRGPLQSRLVTLEAA